MPEDITPSSDGSATPTSDPQPATGNAPGSATLQKPAVTLEEALAQLEKERHARENAEGELKRHRGKLSSYEKAEQERATQEQAAKDAQLSEIERVKKQHADIQAQHNAVLLELQETKISHAVERYAHELHFFHPEIAIRLLDRAELEYEDNGTPKNAKQLLQELLKTMPELARPSEPATPATPAQDANATPTAPVKTPILPAMNPGRAAIQPPAQARVRPSLSDAYRQSAKK